MDFQTKYRQTVSRQISRDHQNLFVLTTVLINSNKEEIENWITMQYYKNPL